jgi:serine phosphatase RsbU (regulator of sigma subunit)/PAS domain-containing protein
MTPGGVRRYREESSVAAHDERPHGLELLDGEVAATVLRTGASAGSIYLIDEDERMLRLAVVCGIPPELVTPWLHVPLSWPSPAADALREERLVWIGRQEDMSRMYPRVAATWPYRLALAAAPLIGVRRPWGALVLAWPPRHPATATHRERSHITSSARRIAQLLDEAPRPAAIPVRPRIVPVHGRTGARSTRFGLAAVDFAERLPEGCVALDLEGRITFVTTTAAELLGRSAQQLLGTRPWESMPWLDDPANEDHYRTAVMGREPVSYAVLRPPDQWLELHLYPDASGISVRVTPIDTGERRRPTHPPPPADTDATAARPVRVGRLYQLVHLAASLTETVGVRDVVDLVATQVVPAFGADGMVISATDAGRLKILGHTGYDPEAIERLDGLPLGTDLSPVGRVLANGVPHFYADPDEISAAYPELPSLSGKQAWAFLPLIVSGRPVGGCAITYDHPHRFTADERAVLTSLAGLVAQALDRARLYDAKQDLAHGLQQALLPHALPAMSGLDVAARYLPASHGMDIGGDFYDLVRLSDTTAAAVIGDVQGHNVTAAALMGQVRTAVHAHATAGAPPGQVLACTNRILADFQTDLFVSCLYAELDLAEHRIAFANAGHPSPLMADPGSRPNARLLDIEPGPLLGIGIDAPYPVTTLPLPPGAILAFYTDGLVEIPGVDMTQSTADLTCNFANAANLPLDELIDELLHRTRPVAERTDDIALLLLKAGC